MTAVVPDREELDQLVDNDDVLRLGDLGGSGSSPDGSPTRPVGEDDNEQAEAEGAVVNPYVTSSAAFLAAASAAWVMAGVFSGMLARLVALLGCFIGAGIVAASYRTRRPMTLQFLVVPVAALVGAVIVAPDATGGTANLPGLVAEALRSGGLSSPPVPFDPGWRFILVVLAALLAATSASLAVAFNRSRLSVAPAVPLVAAAMLVQPAQNETVSALVALVLLVAALAVSFGAQLSSAGQTGGKFELRRLARAGGTVLVMVIAIGALSQAGFLFPEPTDTAVIPPKRPEPPPPAKDRVIFTVAASQQVPWRLGVLDVYGLKERAWLTPPYDPARFVPLAANGAVPDAGRVGTAPDPAAPTVTAKVKITDLEGRVLPVVAAPLRLEGADAEYDPRTQAFQMGGRVRAGIEYTVVGVAPPGADVLNQSGAPHPDLEEYLQAPEPPAIVRDLLAEAPPLEQGRYERLQFVRTRFYSQVVAAGAGKPVDVPPERVAQLLQGKEGSPYEISAAEALLARWAGMPARLGYGYYTGDDPETGKNGAPVEVRPKDGSTWLEAYFEGSGWVPIVGRPPKASASISEDEKKTNPDIRPTDEIALQVYVPLQRPTIMLLYTLISYWVARIAPWAIGILLLWAAYPMALKTGRTLLRRRWAGARAPRARIAVAYAQLRDVAIDFGVGHPTQTPIEFLDALEPDAAHRELAWLVSRTLWGDLLRDTTVADADMAEDLARSVRKRFQRAQPPLLRAMAAISRMSLRDPYSAELPNLWPKSSPLARVRRRVRALGALVHPRRLRRVLARGRRVPAASVLVLIGALVFGGCAQELDLSATTTEAQLATPDVPGELNGVTFKREPSAETVYTDLANESLVSAGRVYSINVGGDVKGSLQIAWFKRGLLDRLSKAKDGLLESLEGGNLQLDRVGDQVLFQKQGARQSVFVWFPPDERYYQLFVAKAGYDPRPLIVSLLRHQRGEAPGADEVELTDVPVFDPRLGGPN